MKHAAFALLCLALPVDASAAETIAVPGPCEIRAEFHQFDFWLGSWKVTDRTTGQYAGRNEIKAEEKGCILFESWTGAAGSTGLSINWFSPETGKWRQVWASAQGYAIDIEGGLTAPGVMRLEGTIDTFGTGVAPFRGTWTKNADGTVRQFFEQKDDKGAWQPWFDGLYTPTK